MNTDDEVPKTAAVSESSGVSQEEKAQWVQRFGESGLSLRQFSAQHGLGYMTLWRWVHKARKLAVATPPPAVPAFAEIKLSGPAQPVPWVAEWSSPSGGVLRVSKEVPKSVLKELLRRC